MAAASSSMALFGSSGGTAREETPNQLMMTSTLQQQHSSSAAAAAPPSSATAATAPPKKRRNQPGNPNPDAEVIALSPKTLMATNRFICEVCNKGFQREQNLQLHRRGHNLPWKLKQKTTKEPKRKVYLCPEPTCVHHDPSRALGDLTGIKKHFSRKHGEKKWKCDKCSKRYAVQSDWKAHSKTCGTREYRCDCGTLFSRRDSFITHRAFCDALAQETARHPSSLNTMGTHLFAASGNTNMMSLGLSNPPNSNMLRLGGTTPAAKFEHLNYPPSNPTSNSFGQQAMPNSSTTNFFNQGFQDHGVGGVPFPNNKALHGLMQLPDLQSNANNSSSPSSTSAANLFNLSFFSNNGTSSGTDQFGTSDQFNMQMGSHHDHQIGSAATSLPSLYGNSIQHDQSHMSATALLQKAAQMGSTTSNESSSLLRGLSSSSTTRAAKSGRQLVTTFSGDHHHCGGGSGEHELIRSSQVDNDQNNLQGLMNSLANGSSSIFGQDHHNNFGGFNNRNFSNVDESAKLHQNLGVSFGGSDKLTLDFLGVGGMVRNLGGGGGGGGSGGYSQQGEQQQQQQHHGHGMNMRSLDLAEQLKSAQETQPFGGTTLQ